MKYDDEGRELPDPTPMAIPAGMKRPESLVDTMRRLIRNEFSKDVGAIGYETFEDANDFDVEEDDAEIRETVYERMQDESPIAPGARPGAAAGGPRDRRPSRSDPDDDGDSDQDARGAEQDDHENAPVRTRRSEGRPGRAGKPQQRPAREAARSGGRQRVTPPPGPGDDEGDDFEDD